MQPVKACQLEEFHKRLAAIGVSILKLRDGLITVRHGRCKGTENWLL